MIPCGNKPVAGLLARLKACRSVGEVKQLQQQLKASDLLGDDTPQLHTALLDAYAKCGSTADARAVFHAMRRRDAVAWNALLHAHAHREPREALRLHSAMPQHTARSYLAALLACTSLRCGLQTARALHAQLPPDECRGNAVLATALLRLYAQCGSMRDARDVFNEMHLPDTAAWNALMSCYLSNGDANLALTLFKQMRDPPPDARSFVAACSACAALAMNEQAVLSSHLKMNSLATARHMHRQAAAQDLTTTNMFVANSFMDLFTRCGSMTDAQRVFDELKRPPNLVSWTTLIQGYTLNGNTQLALELFHRLSTTFRAQPLDATAYVAALNACSASLNTAPAEEQQQMLQTGTAIYSQAVENGFEADMFLASAAIDMFASGGDMASSQRVFDRMQQHDVVSWNALILGYVDNGKPEAALGLFQVMQQLNCAATARTYLGVFKALAQLAMKAEGEQVYDQVVKPRCLQRVRAAHAQADSIGILVSDLYAGNALVDVYAKCGSMVEAQSVFDSMHHHNVVSWATLVAGYADNGEDELVLKLFHRMRVAGFAPEPRVYIAAFTACATLAARDQGDQRRWLESGRGIFSAAAAAGLVSDLFVATAAITMYCKCGRTVEARWLFDCMRSSDVVACNALLGGYAETGGNEEVALELFSCMEDQGCAPNSTTLVMVLGCCAALADREQGEMVDGKLVKLETLRKVMALHRRATAAAAEAEDEGNSDILVANMLVELYGRAGSLMDARNVFDRMMLHTGLSWNALLAAYAESGEAELALRLFRCMKLNTYVDARVPPNVRVFVTALKASGSLVQPQMTRQVHAEIVRCGWEANHSLERSLVEVYGKCGSVIAAEHVFNSAVKRDLSCWNSLLVTYSRNGDARQVIELFGSMVESGVAVDGITFTSLLSACNRAGLVEKGRGYFEAMEERFGVRREVEHYHCMIDMLGRAERVQEAVQLVQTMPFEATRFTWMTLLTACSHSSNVRLAKLAFDQLLELEKQGNINTGGDSASAYVFMANLLTSDDSTATVQGLELTNKTLNNSTQVNF